MRGRSVRRRMSSTQLVGLCVLFTLALRVPFLTAPLLPDEAGLLIIADHWHEGRFLYGDYFVGRGIVLVLVFKLADVLGGPVALRLLACVVAAGLVVSAGWAGHRLRGRAGAAGAALVAAAYASMAAYSANAMNERLVAAALVVTSCACTIAAVTGPAQSARRQQGLAVLAGVTASCAVLVVQSYAQGAIFAAVLLFVSWRTRVLPGADAARVAAAGVLGVLLPVAAVAAAVLTTWQTAAQYWFQLFGYRFSAVGVLGGSTDRPFERLSHLAVVAVWSGMVLLAISALLGYRQLRDRRDLTSAWWAMVAMVAVACVGIALGGDYYSDYLLELVPSLVLLTGLVAPGRAWSGFGMRAGAVLAAVSAGVVMCIAMQRMIGYTTTAESVGQWLSAGAHDDDTAVILWGTADVLYEAGMGSPYPYLWSLLTRTLDPDLDLLLATLRGRDAPTYVVSIYLNAWGLDDSGELMALLADRYVYVGAPCGLDVYLLRTEQRELPAAEACG